MPTNPVPDLARLAAFVRARLAAFVRARLADVAGRTGRAAGDLLAPVSRTELGHASPAHGGVVVVAPTATFAPTSHARARLLRQLHASGLLTRGEVELVLSLDSPRRELPPGA